MSTLGEIAVAMAEWIEHMVRGDNEDHSEILALCEAAREAADTTTRPGFRGVRIPVYVREDGAAYFSHDALTVCPDERLLRWVCASVPLPQPVEVQGEVES